MHDAPLRLRLSRRPGADLQARSRAVNGRDAVIVARPSRWGNPYRVAPAFQSEHLRLPAITRESAASLFEAHWQRMLSNWPSMRRALEDLRGRNLACWCRLCPAHAGGKPFDIVCMACGPCHADVLGRLANRPVCEEVTARAASPAAEGSDHG